MLAFFVFLPETTQMKTGFLFTRISIAPLVFFRMAFGILLAWHAFGMVAGKDIPYLYLTPKYLFPFIGFEWLKPLPGAGMYWYFAVMGVTALFVAAGFLYRYSLGALTLLFTGSYLMQKTIYNNHHYLVILLCILLLFMPANRSLSIDAAIKPSLKQTTMPAWCRYIFIYQMALVYVFAAIAKLYPTWLNGKFISIIMAPHKRTFYGAVVQNHYFQLFLAWGGMLFDFLIIPALLYRRTRVMATLAMLFFHLFNAKTLSIGIFPMLALSMLCFFYEPESIKTLFTKIGLQLSGSVAHNNNVYKYNCIAVTLLSLYALIQLALPLRHHFIEGNVQYTGEGHRLSWRMKLFDKRGTLTMYAQPKGSSEKAVINLGNYFTRDQIARIVSRPDMIWQAAQYIKKDYEAKGQKVAIYATAKMSLNQLPARDLIDENANLADAKWLYFSHCPWIVENSD